MIRHYATLGMLIITPLLISFDTLSLIRQLPGYASATLIFHYVTPPDELIRHTLMMLMILPEILPRCYATPPPLSDDITPRHGCFTLPLITSLP